MNGMSAGILYLHGFCSSPESWKAKVLGEAMRARGLADRFFCPALSPVPNEAIAQAEAMIEARDDELTLVGSSLGGYYATYLAEKHDLRAALVNPAVVAPLSLHAYIGTQKNLHTGETFEFTDMYPPMLEQARAEGHKAKRMFEYAVAAEAVHAKLYQLALDAVTQGKDLAADFYLCPV